MKQKGFTLIELMVVVAIVAILAAVALPAYQDYVTRAQVVEAMSLSGGPKVNVAAFHAGHGRFPVDNNEAGLPMASSIAGTYVTSVEVDRLGNIRASFGNRANDKLQGQALTLTATDVAGHLRWSCAGVQAKYLPSTCR